MPRGCFAATASMPLLVVFILALAAGADSQQAPSPAPSPAGGCTVLLAKVADCLQYITPGSPVSQPPEKCCTEVNSGVKDPAAVACVCDLLGGHTFGLPINLTRAAGLPVACGAPASSLSLCNATPPTPAAPTGGAASKSAATQSPIMAGLLVVVASLLISGYQF
ncbi:unnamed protein product [Urochloa humidicola]